MPAVAPRAEDVLLAPRRGVVADIVIAMAAAALPVIQSVGRPFPFRDDLGAAFIAREVGLQLASICCTRRLGLLRCREISGDYLPRLPRTLEPSLSICCSYLVR